MSAEWDRAAAHLVIVVVEGLTLSAVLVALACLGVACAIYGWPL